MRRARPAPRRASAALAQYLTRVLAAQDPSQLAGALGELAREYGMREVAAAAGISREALYKALRPDAQPRFATISQVLGALGVRLVVEAAEKKTAMRNPTAAVARQWGRRAG